MGQIDWKPKKTIVSPKLKATGGVDYESAILTIQQKINAAREERKKTVTDIDIAIRERDRVVTYRDSLRAGHPDRARLNNIILTNETFFNNIGPKTLKSLDDNINGWEQDMKDLAEQKRIGEIQEANIQLANKGIDANANRIKEESEAKAREIIAQANARNESLLAETKTKILESSSKTNKRIIIAIIVIAVITTAYIIYKRRKKA